MEAAVCSLGHCPNQGGRQARADFYIGVFRNNKRRRVEATYANRTASNGAWQDQPSWINLSGTTLCFSPGAGFATDDIAENPMAMRLYVF